MANARKAVRKAVREMNAARQFPQNTTPCCRLCAGVAEDIAISGKSYWLTEETERLGESLAITVMMLWLAKSKLADLGWKWVDSATGYVRADE